MKAAEINVDVDVRVLLLFDTHDTIYANTSIAIGRFCLCCFPSTSLPSHRLSRGSKILIQNNLSSVAIVIAIAAGMGLGVAHAWGLDWVLLLGMSHDA